MQRADCTIDLCCFTQGTSASALLVSARGPWNISSSGPEGQLSFGGVSTGQGISAPIPHVVQGSTVLFTVLPLYLPMYLRGDSSSVLMNFLVLVYRATQYFIVQ